MRRILCLCVAVLTLAAVGCGGGLDLNMVQSAYKPPSNVAVFFTVDTSSGDPVPGLTAADFRIYEDGEVVSVDESKQTIINPEVAAEHYTLLLVDMSGSVTESDDVPLIEQAASSFTAQLSEYQKVGVYAFDGAEDIYPITPFTRSSGGATGAVNRLSGFHSRDPSTNLNGAIVQAIATLDEAMAESQTPIRFGTIVVFTDGTDRANRVSRDEMDEAVDDADYDIFAIGVGHEIDESTLGSIGRDGYVHAEEPGAVQQAFTDIGNRIIGFTQRYYLLSYCSPSRAGQHEVTIEAVTDNGSGKLTYEFDAEGFGPGCDPNTPPPFDVSGRNRRIRPRRIVTHAQGGGQAEGHAAAPAHPRPRSTGHARAGGGVSAGANVSAGGGARTGGGASAGGDPEAGDY